MNTWSFIALLVLRALSFVNDATEDTAIAHPIAEIGVTNKPSNSPDVGMLKALKRAWIIETVIAIIARAPQIIRSAPRDG